MVGDPVRSTGSRVSNRETSSHSSLIGLLQLHLVPARLTSLLFLVVCLMAPGSSSDAYEKPGRTDLISVPQGGRPDAPGGSSVPHATFSSIAAGGRFVAFESSADDLVDRDVNQMADVFVHDMRTGRNNIVSVAADGSRALGVPDQFGFTAGSGQPSITRNARFIAFPSAAVNLVPGDSNFMTDVFVHDRKTGTTERVSISTDGTQANGHSQAPSISLDGRYVAFESHADNLVERDENGLSDVFIHDRSTGVTERVSVSSSGDEADDFSVCGSLGAGGRYVVFSSWASNIAPTPGGIQVFLRDRKRGTTELVSEPLGGPEPKPALQQGSQACPLGGRSLSADGRYVVFESHMPDFVPNDGNAVVPGVSIEDVFVKDRKSGDIRRVSVTSSGGEVEHNSSEATISPDGRFVSFTGLAPDLSAEQPAEPPSVFSGEPDIFVHDVRFGVTEWISKPPDGSLAGNEFGAAASRFSAIAGGGRYVTYTSNADNLVETSTGSSLGEIFVRDRGPGIGVGSFASSTSMKRLTVVGAPDFARTRVAQVRSHSADPLLSAQHTTATGATIVYRPALDDLLVRLRLPRATPNSFLIQTAGVTYGLGLNIDGRSYELRASLPTFGGSRAPAPRFELVSCMNDPLPCNRIRTLEGGFGTTGSEIVIAAPLGSLGVRDGSAISDLIAFTSIARASTAKEGTAGEPPLPSVGKSKT